MCLGPVDTWQCTCLGRVKVVQGLVSEASSKPSILFVMLRKQDVGEACRNASVQNIFSTNVDSGAAYYRARMATPSFTTPSCRCLPLLASLDGLFPGATSQQPYSTAGLHGVIFTAVPGSTDEPWSLPFSVTIPFQHFGLWAQVIFSTPSVLVCYRDLAGHQTLFT